MIAAVMLLLRGNLEPRVLGIHLLASRSCLGLGEATRGERPDLLRGST